MRAAVADEATWRSAYECQFVDESHALLPYDLLYARVDDALSYHLNMKTLSEAGDLYAGYDVGRKHDLSVLVVLERLKEGYRWRGAVELQESPFDEQFELLASVLSERGLRRLAIDQSGLGMQLAEQLVHRPLPRPYRAKSRHRSDAPPKLDGRVGFCCSDAVSHGTTRGLGIGGVQAIHGASYTRLYNADLLTMVREFATDFVPPQPAGMDGSRPSVTDDDPGSPGFVPDPEPTPATGLYCGEQDMFCFLIDPTGWAEIEDEAFAPGFFIWNSEVGKRSVGVQTFWFQAVCQNHVRRFTSR